MTGVGCSGYPQKVWYFVIFSDWTGLRDGTTQGIYDSDDEIGWLDGRYSSAIWTWLAAA